MIQMYNPVTGGVADTTEEAYDTVWSRDGRGWKRVDEALPELLGKVFADPENATDGELRVVLGSGGERFAATDGETRQSMLDRLVVLEQHASSPQTSEVGAALAAITATTWDPAEYNVDQVNAYLANASEPEHQRVLDLEAKVRPDVPEAKQRRAGILNGPHAEYTHNDLEA